MKIPEAFRLFSRYSGLVVVAVGVTVLMGWWLNIAVLKNVFPGLVVMQPDTALAFILAGFALRMLGAEKAGLRMRRIGHLCAWLATLIGVLALFEHLFGLDTGIDQWLFQDIAAAASPSHPERMAPSTALNFLMTGLALSFLDWETGGHKRPAEYLALSTAIVAFLALEGYAYEVPSLNKIALYTSMSLHTAASFALLAVGILAARPHRGLMTILTNDTAGARLARQWIPYAIGIPLILGWARLAGERGGLYDTEIGVSLFALASTILFTSLVGVYAHSLNKAEGRRTDLEKSLEASAAQFRGLIESAPDAVVIANREGRIKLVNHQAEKLFGYARPELLDQPLEILMPERFREAHRVHRAGYAETPKVRTMGGGLELMALHKDGTEFSTEINLSPMETPNGLVIISTIRDITERKQAEEMVQRVAYEDAVTGLPNRNSLYDRLMNAIREDDHAKIPMALLLMDLERFKEVNDTFGHLLGDQLLREVGRRVQEAVRNADFVARLGGDEFAILLSRLRNIEDIDRVIKRIQICLEPSFQLEAIPVAVEASIGMALYPVDGQDADTLLRHADVAMYEAKKSGRGYARYLPEKDHHSRRRLALIGELRYAIEHDELLLYYQPKINLKTGRISGVEALARWKHPHRGMIPPDEFIPAAERTGLIKPLTEWVINAALRQGQAWSQMGLSLAMAVNVSVRNLLDPGFPGWLSGRLQTSVLSPADVRLEITESTIMTEPEQTIEILNRLKETGVKLSIDDFGTGYTSLSLLEKMPVHEIKVDKYFVFKLAQDLGGTMFIQSMVDLAHHLGYTAVAEGVETEAVLEKLSAMGCDEAQGYYMAKPMPADELTRWLRESPWGLRA